MYQHLIYIDADNFESQHASSLLGTLRQRFGTRSLFRIFHSSDECNYHKKQKLSLESWTRACNQHGHDITRIQPANRHKNSADIALSVAVYDDLINLYTPEQRKSLSIVIVSGDSDFYYMAKSLSKIVGDVIICGKKIINQRFKNCARFISFETLIGLAQPQPLEQARDLIIKSVKTTESSEELCIKQLESKIIDFDNCYWPDNYGFSTTGDLLLALGHDSSQPILVKDLLSRRCETNQNVSKLVPVKNSKNINNSKSVNNSSKSSFNDQLSGLNITNLPTSSNPIVATVNSNPFTGHHYLPSHIDSGNPFTGVLSGLTSECALTSDSSFDLTSSDFRTSIPTVVVGEVENQDVAVKSISVPGDFQQKFLNEQQQKFLKFSSCPESIPDESTPTQQIVTSSAQKACESTVDTEVKVGRRCTICREPGHNKRTCPNK
ncbi:hypothetical protein GEMRC1_013628 [Eukaryota sp. GEM-RC1]